MKRSPGSRSLLFVLLGFGVYAWSSGAAFADTEDGARKHASKANHLAAKNNCKAAIFEFTRALKTLKDPVLLFNRAECFRKVGRNDEAITDYERFLAEMPQTPNRPVVEARLASLRGSAGAAAAGKDVAAKEPPKEAAPVKEPAAVVSAPASAVPSKAPAQPSGDPLAKPAGAAVPAPAAKPAAPPAAASQAKPAPAPVPPAPAAKPEENPASAPKVRKAEKWTD